MELYLNEYSPRTSTLGSHMDIYDLVRTRRSIADDKSGLVKFIVALAVLLSTALKIYALIVFFSRMQVQVFLLTPNREIRGEQKRTEIFSDFITDFSFPEMVQDFWKARAYLVSTVIVLGSAVVPLAKHLFMLFAWLVPLPTEWLPLRRRILFFFDQTGRTALVDLFLLGYVICIFYTNVVQDLGGYGLQLLLSGEPVRGLFCGVASTFTGSLLSHYLLLAHDEQNLGDFDNQVTVAAGPAVASLMQRLYASPVSLAYKRAISLLVTLLIVGSGVSLAFIVFQGFEVVSFHMEGLAGSVANSGWREFNLLTAALNMPKNSNEVLGTKFLAVLHIALVVAVPIGLLISATILWFFPIHLRPQRRFLSLFPFWNSWCSLDVFLVTSFAAYKEMHLIAEFIFDKNFHFLCANLKKLGVTCVDLGHSHGIGLYLLLLATILFASLSVVLGKVGNDLLETAANRLESGISINFSPHWDDVVNVSPLTSRMASSNDYIVLNSAHATSPPAPSSVSAVGTPKKNNASSSLSYW